MRIHTCIPCFTIYSISSPIRHTCSINVLSKILMRIYHIIVQKHIYPQSKITEVHQNLKSHQLYVLVRISKTNMLKVCLIGDEIGYKA